jgi:hypothetical protein
MPDTTRLEAQADRARNELAALDRIISESKDSLRASIFILAGRTGVEDDGKCFETILEAVDDLMHEAREEIRERIDAADEEISNIEYADLRRSSPVVL